MQPVSDATHRVLSYLLRLHSKSQSISREHLDAFFNIEEPKRPEESMDYSDLASSLNRLLMFEKSSLTGLGGFARSPKKPSFTDYSEKLGWIKAAGPARDFRLTNLGVAFAAALDAPVILEEGEYAEIIMRPEDPFGYAKVVAKFASLGPGLIVDAYLKVEQFIELRSATSINRYLVGDRELGSKQQGNRRRETMQFALGQAQETTMRLSPDLHDRYFIPDEAGPIWTLGISMNGVKKHFSVLTRLEGGAADAIREFVQTKWDVADALLPREQDAGNDEEPPTTDPLQ